MTPFREQNSQKGRIDLQQPCAQPPQRSFLLIDPLAPQTETVACLNVGACHAMEMGKVVEGWTLMRGVQTRLYLEHHFVVFRWDPIVVADGR